MFNFGNIKLQALTYVDPKQFAMLILAFLISVIGLNSNELMSKFKPNYKYLFICVVLVILSFFHLEEVGEFLYFQF